MANLSLHTCDLPFSSPYDWETVLAYFRNHQLPFLETVDHSAYERVVAMQQGLGWFRVEQLPGQHFLSLSVWNGTDEDVNEISNSVRNMFDLDADPAGLLEAMKGDRFLSGFWANHPGLRLPRPWSVSEAILTTVLGQVVSVAFGRSLTGELMRAAGSMARHPKTSEPIPLFPSAGQILEADLSGVRTSEARRTTIRLLAKAMKTGSFDQPNLGDGKVLRKALRGVPGIGAWTVEYVAMRGFRDNDAFPATDYVLKQELKRHPEINVKAVRPWRGYAAIALWKSFAEAKRLPADDSVTESG